MNISDLFTWTYFGLDATAKRDYQDDADAYQAVTQYFMAIDGTALGLLILCIVIPLAMCWYYHFPFNRMRGRHYRPVYNWLFCGCAALTTLIISWIFELIIVKVPFSHTTLGTFRFDVALGTLVWSILVYLITALIMGATKRSNAFPLHKQFAKK